ncbi:MAG: hypothetical protein JWQ17_1188 [Tardiphaga sp.]|nr:hypothetical protein [Tardiphaga sp.]
MVGEVCSAHSQLGNPGIELDRPDDLQSPLCDVRLDQMGGHVSPAETGQQHRLLGAEVRQAPGASGQHAVIPSRGQRRAVGQHELNMVVQNMRFDRSIERPRI